MHGKRLKLIYFSTGDSEVKEYSLGWQKLLMIFFGFLITCILIVFISLTIFTDYFNDASVASLKKTNSQLKDMLSEMEKKVKKIEGGVEYIKKTDRDLRIFLDMADYTEDERKLGRGGLIKEPYSVYSNSTDEALNNATRINKLLDELDKRMEFATESRDEISRQRTENDERWRHLPSIRPVAGGRVTDTYGWRIHPLTQQRQFHEGLDISASRGTPIRAPADGVVERVISKYKPNQSYGREILIDHGNGVKTLYAHLRNIHVQVGDTVKRYQEIGTVGDSGRATGPHLHYEVHKDSESQNPVDYILE